MPVNPEAEDAPPAAPVRPVPCRDEPGAVDIIDVRDPQRQWHIQPGEWAGFAAAVKALAETT